MRILRINSLVFIFLLCFFTLQSCIDTKNDVTNKSQKAWPIVINENDERLDSILASGEIGESSSELIEGGKEHTYTLYLSDKGLKEKYDIIGYHNGRVGYYEVKVENPYTFNERLKKYGISVSSSTIITRHH